MSRLAETRRSIARRLRPATPASTMITSAEVRKIFDASRMRCLPDHRTAVIAGAIASGAAAQSLVARDRCGIPRVSGSLPERPRTRGTACGRSENAATKKPKCRRNAPQVFHESAAYKTRSRVSTLALQVHALDAPERAIPLEGPALVLEAQDRSECGPPERMPQHLDTVAQREQRRVRQGHREMLELDPALGLPAQKLDLVRLEMRGSHHRGGAVVLLEPLVDDETLVAKGLRHRGSRIGRRVLDVRHVDVAADEVQVGLDRLARISRIADDQPADDVHLVLVQGLEIGRASCRER